MSHIVIDARIINSSTGRYVERLVTYLQDSDTANHYTILVRAKDKDFWQPTASNFSIAIADFDNYSFAEQTKFYQFLNQLSPDLVHFCMPQQPLRYKGKQITTFHDLTLLNTYNSDKNWIVYHTKQLVGRFVFKKVAQKSNHIITPSHFTKDELLKFSSIPEKKVSVIYEAADLVTAATEPYKHPYKRYLLYVGQQSDYKNIRRLADAHQQLLKNNPDLGLLLVGKLNASAKANQTYFAQKHYKNITFTDFLADDQLNWLYAHAEAYVFPSLMEGFGLPGLEAMLHGTPVISSNTTCLPEIYGKAAYYFNPYNVSDIVKAATEILHNQSLRQQLIKEGYDQVKKYSWKKMAEQTHHVYQEVLTNSTEQ